MQSYRRFGILPVANGTDSRLDESVASRFYGLSGLGTGFVGYGEGWDVKCAGLWWGCRMGGYVPVRKSISLDI